MIRTLKSPIVLNFDRGDAQIVGARNEMKEVYLHLSQRGMVVVPSSDYIGLVTPYVSMRVELDHYSDWGVERDKVAQLISELGYEVIISA